MAEENFERRPFVAPPGSVLGFSAGARETSETPHEHCAFVMNVSSLVGAASFSLGSGHELRRASTEEITAIKETLQNVMRRPSMMPWELKSLPGGSVEPLKEEEWHYYVISFQGTNEKLVEIEEACSLAPLELKIGFTLLNYAAQQGLIFHPGRLLQLLDNAMWNLAFSDVALSDVEAIRIIHAQLCEHDPRLVDVRRLARQLQDLDAVPPHSPLRFLGHFAVLESLLTHPPKPTDPYDSITRQIKKKVKLVDHRCQPHLDYSPFVGTDAETVWTKMYAYRSSLAHGGAPNFEREFQVLGNHSNALRLVKETVKAVIRQALIEPQLLADLKDC
jgi:hypothetical protein